VFKAATMPEFFFQSDSDLNSIVDALIE